MSSSILLLVLSLALILLACHWFTNAIEWFGKKLNLGAAIIGSVFAAIGTALPETIIPVIAIIFVGDQAVDIGIGAIAGAPFMLTTLGLFVTGASVVVYRLLRIRTLKMTVDCRSFSRDLLFFLVVYGTVVVVGVTPLHEYFAVKAAVAGGILLAYVLYVRRTFSENTGHSMRVDPLLLGRLFRRGPSMGLILLQLGLSLGLIVGCAHMFVVSVTDVSNLAGISPLVLSLIITPIATELPEKFNSIIWIGKHKDTLAIGNISGAMTFQSCIPVAIALCWTQWDLNGNQGRVLASAVLALASAGINFAYLKITRKANPFMLIGSGVFYGLFIAYLATRS